MTETTSTTAVPNVQLNNGVQIPQLGFGVFQIDPAETAAAVSTAFEVGYRHIDTAEMYGNEKGVGEAIAASGLARDEVFVTSKLNNGFHAYDDALRAFDQTLADLKLEQIDLFLIHWPLPKVGDYVETWRAMEKIYTDGGARAIGVSNFHAPHLQRVIDESGTVPAVNQIELHPYLTQQPLREFDTRHRIATEAWSPLASGGNVLADPVITSLAEKYGKTPAQVILAWHLQLGNVVIPKSVTPARIRENFAVFDVELDPDDVVAISGLDRDGRTGPNPETFNP